MIQTLLRTAWLTRTLKTRGTISRIFSFILPIAIPVRVSAQGRVVDSPGPLPASDNGLTGARARGAGSWVLADRAWTQGFYSCFLWVIAVPGNLVIKQVMSEGQLHGPGILRGWRRLCLGPCRGAQGYER